MSQEWDFYPCRVDDAPASIYLDLGLAHSAPREDYPQLLWVRVPMRAPRPDGLSSNEEYEVLVAIEDALEQRLCHNGAALYAGRTTSAGCRDLFFYTPAASDPQGLVEAALQGFAGYSCEIGVRPDPQWQTYFEFLYPAPADLQCLLNRRVYRALEERGEAFAEARVIRHWAYFPSPEARAAFCAAAAELGCAKAEEVDASAQGAGLGVCLTHEDIPVPARLDPLTIALRQAAHAQAGRYDGWETSIVS